MAIASSYDPSGRYGTEVAFSDNIGTHFAGGEWRADSTHDAIITVINSGTQVAQTLLTLHYRNGEMKYEVQRTLKPAEQIWLRPSDLIHRQIPDRKGNTLPSGLSVGTFDVRDIGGKPGSLLVSTLATDNTFGSHIGHPVPECCSTTSPQFQPGFFEVDLDGLWDPFVTLATDACSGDQVPLDMQTFWPTNSAIAQITTQGVKGLSVGTTTGNGESDLVWVGQGSNCILKNLYPTAPITVESVPSSETTEYQGTYQNTEGQFLMTLNPNTAIYNGHSVKETSPMLGSNSCWWNGSGIVQYPVVQGSTWIVDQGNAGQNQYGFDTVGFGYGVVNLIRTQGAAHGVEFPCNVYIHQSMNYDGIDLYVTNLLSQTIGSTNVTVCRAGVCATIPF